MSTIQEQWGAIYEAFDPRKPAESAVRAERPYSRTATMAGELRAPRNKKLLFKGTSGNGKTTELLHLVEAMGERRFVVFFDFEQHFRTTMRDDAALQTTQPWELLFLVGAAVWRAGNELGIPWTPAHKRDLEAAYEKLLTPEGGEAPKVDLVAVAGTLALLIGGGTSLSLGVAPVAMGALVPGLTRLASIGKWELPFTIGGRGALPDQDAHVTRLVHAVDAMLLHVAGLYQRPLLVLDGLDRLRPDAADRHFVTSGLLTDLSCSLVLTAPMSVSATRSPFDKVCTLENVPVLDHAAPPAPGAGVIFFREVWAKRAGSLAGALSEPQVDRLAWASGGLLRHFCRLARSVVELAELDAATRVEDAWIEAAIDERRRELEDGMTREEFALLQGVADDPRHELPDGVLARALLGEHRLVPYPNQSTWYFPHPLLTLSKVRAGPPSGSSGS